MECKFDVHTRILSGINKLADAVGSTLGPGGRNVIVSRGNKPPLIFRDGVSVAKSIDLDDPVENIGCQLIKSIASKTNMDAGDGTTTSTVLARALYREGLKLLAAGWSQVDLKTEINSTIEDIISNLRSKKVTTKEETYRVAYISTNGDRELSEKISEGFHRIGPHGMFNVENSDDTKTHLKFVEGYQIERGLLHGYFINNLARTRTEYNNPHIVILNYQVTDIKKLLPLLKMSKETPVILIAEAFEDNLYAALVKNRLDAKLKLNLLHLPGSGDYKQYYIDDLAAVVGATVFYDDHGPKIEDTDVSLFGSAERVVTTLNDTAFIGAKGRAKDLAIELKEQMDNLEQNANKDILKDRISRLNSDIAILKVGAATDTELQDIKLRVEDAINATRVALEEGILPGGGVALYRSKLLLDNPISRMVDRVLEEQIRYLLTNAGENVERILSEIDDKYYEYGYDVRKKKFGDLYDLGVIDPLKVVKSALKNAASIAGMLLTSSCVIYEEKKNA